MWLAACSTEQLMSGSEVTTLHFAPARQVRTWDTVTELVLATASEREKSCSGLSAWFGVTVIWVASDQVAVTESGGCGQWQPAEWSREGPRTGTHHTQDSTFPVLIKGRFKAFMKYWISHLVPSVNLKWWRQNCSNIILRMSLCVIWCYVRESDLYCCETMWNIPIIRILQSFCHETWTLFLQDILLSELCWFSFIYFPLEIQHA